MSQLNLSKNLKESSAHIYRKSFEKNIIRGRTIEGMLLGSVSLACKLNNIPKSLENFLDYTTIDKKNLSRCYRIILKELKVKYKITYPQEFIKNF